MERNGENLLSIAWYISKYGMISWKIKHKGRLPGMLGEVGKVCKDVSAWDGPVPVLPRPP